MRLPVLLPLLFSACALFALPTSAQLICPTPNPNAGTASPLSAANVTFASEINQDRSRLRALRNVLHHFRDIEAGVRDPNPSTHGAWQCLEDWQRTGSVLGYLLREYGWGTLGECEYAYGDRGPPNRPKKAPEVFRQVQAFIGTLEDMSKEVLASYGRDWAQRLTTDRRVHETKDAYGRCTLLKTQGFRIRGRWGAAASFTDEPTGIAAPKRQVLTEVIALAPDGSAIEVPVKMSPCRPGNASGVARPGGTGAAFLIEKRGFIYDAEIRPAWSPSIRAALSAGLFEKEMVEDSDTFSNLAIIAFPAMFALLPIALFQDTSLQLTLVYAIATDAVSVLPMAIKGVELIVYGSRDYYAYNMILYGPGEKSDVSVLSVWVARCRMVGYVRQMGIGLLVGAATAMVIGVALEFVCRIVFSRGAKRPVWRGSVALEHGTFDEIMELPSSSVMATGLDGWKGLSPERQNSVVELTIVYSRARDNYSYFNSARQPKN